MSLKLVSVSCLDLERLLDWCESAHYITDAGIRIGITDGSYYYSDAYHNLILALHQQIRSDSNTHARMSGGIRHV